MKKPVVSFRIEPEQRAALDSLCAATGKEGTFHMRQALEQYLERYTHNSPKAAELRNWYRHNPQGEPRLPTIKHR